MTGSTIAHDVTTRKAIGLPWLDVGIPCVLFVAAIEALQNSFTLREVGWPLLFIYELPVWLVWLTLCAPIFALSHRFPLIGPRWKRNLPIHLGASVLAPLVLITTVTFARLLMTRGILGLDIPLTPPHQAYVEIGLNVAAVLPRSLQRYFAFPVILYFSVVAIYPAISYYDA